MASAPSRVICFLKGEEKSQLQRAEKGATDVVGKSDVAVTNCLHTVVPTV